jgi:hypothetical protein
MDNTVDDVMIVCKTRNHQNFAKAFAGSAKLHVISNDIHMTSAS